MYDKLVAKVNNIDASVYILKAKYNADKTELGKKVYDTSGFVKKKQQIIILKLANRE